MAGRVARSPDGNPVDLWQLQCGDLSMGSIASKNFGQDFGLDQLNNWSTYGEDPDGTGMSNLSQTRGHSAANEIEEIDSANTFVAHDAAGNMTTVPKPGIWNAGLILTWDAWNRLVKVGDGVNTIAEYQYDGKNRRIVKKVYSSGSLDHTQHFYLSEANQVLEVRNDASANAHKQFTWGERYIDDLVLRTRDLDNNGTLDETLYAIQDANWDITALADTSGTVLERFRYDPYGRNLVLEEDFAVDPDGQSDYDWEYRFTSREYDPETSLHYFRARYWHPDLGRFIGRDPLEYIDGASLYAGYFVPDAVDPTGYESSDMFYNYDPPYRPEPPFPGPGEVISGENTTRAVPFYLITSFASKRKDRTRPFSNPSNNPNQLTPNGPNGGRHAFYGPTTTETIGGGGADTCLIVVIKAPRGIAVYHFKVGDSPASTLRRYDWSGCSAIVCGSNESDPQSNCLADEVLQALKVNQIRIDGVAENSACGINPDGTQYAANK